MNDIIESIRNGQRKQAFEQLLDSPYLLEDLFQQLLKEDMAKEIIIMYRIAIHNNYLTFRK